MDPVDITPRLLRELIRYEPETGKMFWKHRADRFFSDPGSAFLWNVDNAGQETFKKSEPNGYRKMGLLGKHLWGHRVAWAIVHGKWPKGHIDHINGQKRDNRICNLREASAVVNGRNMVLPSNNTSGHIGVRLRYDGKYTAHILQSQIGVYDTFDEAVKARETAQAETPGFTERHGKPKIIDYGFSHLKQARLAKRAEKRAAKGAAA